MVSKIICFVGLLIMPIVSQAAMLKSGDILSFSTAAGSYVSGIAAGGTAFDGASLDSFNGLTIGVAQPGFPDIDQQWTSAQFGVVGNHSTISAVSVLNESEMDFSGWTMNIGGEAYNFGATQQLASYTFDGSNFTIDYHWDAISDNGGVGLGALDVSSYDLKLVGTVSSVPIPAAGWLLVTALISLFGLKRKAGSMDLSCQCLNRG